MGGIIELTIFVACFNFVIYLYAGISILIGILDWLLIFLIFSSVIFGIILRFRVPRPKTSKVNHLLGNEWGAYQIFSDSSKTSNDYVMKVVGHRACGLDAPENSVAALKKICNEGITAVEFDVMLTSDKVPIVFHDPNLIRMTGINKIVEHTTWEELKSFDISVKHPFGENFKGERIATLDEYVSFCVEKEIRMFIDLKNDDMRVADVINNLYKQYPKLYELAVVSSFNVFLIYQIRSRDPDIVGCVAWRPYFYSHRDYNGLEGPSEPRSSNPIIQSFHLFLNHFHYWILSNFGYYVLGLSALLLHKDIVTRNDIHYWCKRGIRVIAWSVNLPTEKQYFEKILQITYLTDTVINS